MRRLLALALSLALLGAPSASQATHSLEHRVQSATGIARSVDSHLRGIAAARAVEITADFSHSGMRPGTAEVIPYTTRPDPDSWVVPAWLASPGHNAILTDPALSRIGCAYADGTSPGGLPARFYACVLARAPSQGPPAPAPTPSPAPARSPSPVPATPASDPGTRDAPRDTQVDTHDTRAPGSVSEPVITHEPSPEPVPPSLPDTAAGPPS